MAIKIKKSTRPKERSEYKSSKRILTPRDIKDADKFDFDLERAIKELESILLKQKILSPQSQKKDPLKVWYLIGKHINQFLKKHQIVKEEEGFFWNYLYGRSPLIHKGIPTQKISQTRNDFRTATLLAKYPFQIIIKVGSWSLWREILNYRAFLEDKRVLKFVMEELIRSPRTRNEARPLLKSIAGKLSRIDTSVLSDQELLRRLRS